MAASMKELTSFVIEPEYIVESRGEASDDASGSYGFVYEVKVKGVVRIAKKPHRFFLKNASEAERARVLASFKKECVLLNKLRHPNVVKFVGVYFGEGGEDDISMVMEKVHFELASFLRDSSNVQLATKLSILQDVSYGLVYLHEYNPPIIHRDLTARNILLTKVYQAKIADVGGAKLLDQTAMKAASHTKVPGQMFYMPPEACMEKAECSSKLDIFSFGHLSLHVLLEDYPEVFEVKVTPKMLSDGTVQIMKRKSSLDRVENSHCLYTLITQCLMDEPEKRPSTRDVNSSIADIKEANSRDVGEIQSELRMEHPSHNMVSILDKCLHESKENSVQVTNLLAEKREFCKKLEERDIAILGLRQESDVIIRKKQDLEAKCARMSSSNSDLVKTISKQDQKMKELQAHIEVQSRAVAQLRADVSAEFAKYQESEDEKDRLKEDFQSARETIHQLRKEISSRQRGLASLPDTKDVGEIQSELRMEHPSHGMVSILDKCLHESKENSVQVTNLLAEKRELSKKLEERDIAILALQQVSNVIIRKNQDLEAKCARMSNSVQVTSLLAEKRMLNIKLEERDKTILGLRQESDVIIHKKQYLETKCASMSSRIRDLVKTISNQDQKMKELQAHIGVQSRAVVQLRTEVSAEFAKYEESEDEKDRLKEDFQSARETIDQLRKEISSRQQGLASLPDTTKELSVLKEELVSARLNISSLEKIMEQLLKERDTALDECAIAGVQAETFKADFEAERKDRARAHGLLDGFKNETSTCIMYEKAFANLQQELQGVNRNWMDSKKKLNETEVELKKCKSDSSVAVMEHFKTNIEKLTQEKEQCFRDMGKVKGELKSMKDVVMQLRREIDNKAKEISSLKAAVKSKERQLVKAEQEIVSGSKAKIQLINSDTKLRAANKELKRVKNKIEMFSKSDPILEDQPQYIEAYEIEIEHIKSDLEDQKSQNDELKKLLMEMSEYSVEEKEVKTPASGADTPGGQQCIGQQKAVSSGPGPQKMPMENEHNYKQGFQMEQLQEYKSEEMFGKKSSHCNSSESSQSLPDPVPFYNPDTAETIPEGPDYLVTKKKDIAIWGEKAKAVGSDSYAAMAVSNSEESNDNQLHKDIDEEIHIFAEEVNEQVNRDLSQQVTEVQLPLDPNLL